MNIGTHFWLQQPHRVFISTHTKIGTPHEKASITVVKQIQVLAKTSNGSLVSYALRWWVGGGGFGNNRSIADYF